MPDVAEKDWGAVRNSDWKWIVNKVQEQSDEIERLRTVVEEKNKALQECWNELREFRDARQ